MTTDLEPRGGHPPPPCTRPQLKVASLPILPGTPRQERGCLEPMPAYTAAGVTDYRPAPRPRPGCDSAPASKPWARHPLLQEAALARRQSSRRQEADPGRRVTAQPASVGPTRRGARGFEAGTARDLEQAARGPRRGLPGSSQTGQLRPVPLTERGRRRQPS